MHLYSSCIECRPIARCIEIVSRYEQCSNYMEAIVCRAPSLVLTVPSLCKNCGYRGGRPRPLTSSHCKNAKLTPKIHQVSPFLSSKIKKNYGERETIPSPEPPLERKTPALQTLAAVQYKLGLTVHRVFGIELQRISLTTVCQSLKLLVASTCDMPHVINCQFCEFTTAPLGPVHFLSPDQESGIHWLIICGIQLLTPSSLGET